MRTPSLSSRSPLFLSLLALGAVASIPATARTASADDLPTGTAGAGAVSKGANEVTTVGKVETAQKADPAAKDATEWSLNAGGMLTTGNSRSMAGTFGTAFRARRDGNQFSAIGAANYGGNTPTGGGDFVKTADNQQLKARYDRFLSGEFVAFLGAQVRRDSLAGLVPRTQIDPGFGYYFYDTATSSTWVEAGYDFLYDRRSEEAIDSAYATAFAKDPATAVRLDKTATAHSARLFYGLKSKLAEGTTITLALEFLQALSRNAATDNHPFRLNGDLIVNAKLTKTFSLAASYSLKYDTGALPGKEKLDTITALSLVYTIL
jgi:putative salt-induced outer membrane protein